MKRLVLSMFAVALAAQAATSSLSAQSKVSVGVGGGLTVPLGDFGDAAKLGWHGTAHLGYGLPSGLGFRGEFFYGQNKVDANVDAKFKLAGGMGSVTYDIKTGSGLKPYILGGVGYFQVKAEGGGGSISESKVAFGGGAGLKFKAGSDANIFVESRYLSVSTSGSSTTFIPLTVGVSFGFK